MDGHDGGDGEVGDAKDLVGLVGLPQRRAQGRDKQVAPAPNHPITIHRELPPVVVALRTAPPAWLARSSPEWGGRDG